MCHLMLASHSLHCSRNLYKWVERLKSELPYYESCNAGQTTLSSPILLLTVSSLSAGIEMFKTWAKSKSKSYTTKGK